VPDDFDWNKAREDAKEAARKKREAREREVQERMEREVIEEMSQFSDENLDAESIRLLDQMGISQDDLNDIRNTTYDDPKVKEAIAELREADKAWTLGGRRRKTRNALKKMKPLKNKIKSGKKSKGCAVIAIAMIGSVAGFMYAGYEVVSRLM
jgi:hypothetical protein